MDKRELILEQLLVILGEVGVGWVAQANGEASVFRNRAEIPADKLPALVLLDGKETLVTSTAHRDSTGLIPRQLPPAVYNLQPQVFVVLKPRNTIANEGIGQELSMMRMKLLNAILNDANLDALLGSNGDVSYNGHETDMQTGSTVEGSMRLDFALTYVLDPRDL